MQWTSLQSWWEEREWDERQNEGPGRTSEWAMVWESPYVRFKGQDSWLVETVQN